METPANHTFTNVLHLINLLFLIMVLFNTITVSTKNIHFLKTLFIVIDPLKDCTQTKTLSPKKEEGKGYGKNDKR